MTGIHFLDRVDPATRRGVCRVCGPVPVRPSGRGYLACSVGKAQQQYRARLKREYGLTLEEWTAMLVAQSGRCLVCNDPMREPATDHCHSTGLIRGLLCSPCNKGLGNFSDDVSRLQAAITYLQQSAL